MDSSHLGEDIWIDFCRSRANRGTGSLSGHLSHFGHLDTSSLSYLAQNAEFLGS